MLKMVLFPQNSNFIEICCIDFGHVMLVFRFHGTFGQLRNKNWCTIKNSIMLDDNTYMINLLKVGIFAFVEVFYPDWLENFSIAIGQ